MMKLHKTASVFGAWAIAFLTGCIVCFCLSSCTTKETSEQRISVTIAPLAYLVESIAGDSYPIETLVPRGSSPETYEPTPKQLMHVNQSALYFFVGNLGFEQVWLKRMQQNAPNTQFVNTSNGIDFLHTEHHHSHDHGDETSNVCRGADPHIWTTPRNLKIMATNIAQQLTKAFPKDSTLFAHNLKILNDSLDATDKKIRCLLNNKKHTAFLIYHPTLSYFAQEYHLEQLAIEKDGKSPSPAHLQQIIRLCHEKKIHTVFLQQEFDRHHAEIIAQETNTQIQEINPLSQQCIEELIRVAQTLHDAYGTNTDYQNK